jgi:hypothetical protein
MVKNSKRSPLKDKPLRNPGQSVQREIENLLHEDAIPSVIVIGILLISTLLVWVPVISRTPPIYLAIAFTTMSLIGIPICLYKISYAIKKAQPLKMARDGERDIAEYLNELRALGCHVLHDLPGKNFNIDHIIVSKQGVFAVETKTFSKSTEHDEIIAFNGKTIKIGNYENTEIIKQAEIERASLKKIIEDCTGKTFHIKSVVTFPGWFIKTTGRDEYKNLFVFNPNYFAQLENYIRNFVE